MTAPEAVEVDWVAGLCMLFLRLDYASVGGFDENYFMCVEDVDICRKVHEFGLKVGVYPKFSIIHNANRQSRRNLMHLLWHFTSFIRYFVKWRLQKMSNQSDLFSHAKSK